MQQVQLLWLVQSHETLFIPVDSEHSALFQCLAGVDFNMAVVKQVTLTASGGPFFGRDSQTFDLITPKDARLQLGYGGQN